MDIISPYTPQKQCTKCKQFFPATSEFFHGDKWKKDGLKTRCKTCELSHQKIYRSNPEVQEHRKAIREIREARPEIQARRKAYQKEYLKRPEVQEHRRKHQQAYLQRPEIKAHRQAHRKLYDSRPEIQDRHKAYHKAYLAEYRSKNRDQLNKKKKIYYHRPDIHAQYRAMRNAWYKTPEARDILRARNQRRRARKINAPGTHTHTQIQEQLKRQRYKCYYCSAKLEKEHGKYIYHIDHIIPLSRGGSDDISNLVVTCPFCNLSKHDRLPHEWPQGNRLL